MIVLILGCLLANGAVFRVESLPRAVNTELSNVNDILQDRAGFIWFASQNGLFRYDGYELDSFESDPADPAGLPSNWVTSLAEDHRGGIWIGLKNGGLCRLGLDRAGLACYSPSLPELDVLSSVRTLHVAEDGTLWAGLDSGGLVCFREGEPSYIIPDDGEPGRLPGGPVTATFSVGAETWVGTGRGGLSVLDSAREQVERVEVPSRITDQPVVVWTFVADGEDGGWLGTNQGLYRFHASERGFRQFFPEPDELLELEGFIITTLALDERGHVWGGTDGSGAFRFEPRTETFRFFRHGEPGSLPHNDVNEVFIDQTGLIWFGTLVDGVSTFDPNALPFQTWRNEPGSADTLSDSFTKVVFEDRDGSFWIGGNNGLDHRLSDGHIVRYRNRPDDPTSLGHNFIRAIVGADDGGLWIGTWGGGLNHYSPETGSFERYMSDEGDWMTISSNYIETLYLDEDGALWLGSNQGLEVFDTRARSFTRVPTFFAGEDDQIARVRVVRALTNGELFLGSNFGMGILNRETHEITQFRRRRDDPQSLPDNVVRDFLKASDGTIWVATSGGLAAFDRERGGFETHTERDGLASKVIYSILEDGRGYLWLGTHNGLSRFDPEARVFVNFSVEDGIQGSEFNAGAALEADDGRLFFGGTRGVTWFHPDRIVLAETASQVYLSRFKLFNEVAPWLCQLDERGRLVLGPDENFLAFDLAVMDFRDPPSNLFSYTMEGVDEGWSTPTSRRYVNYPDLDPGSYTLRVRGANSKGVWAEEDFTLAIHIETPLTGRMWFKVLAGAFFLLPLMLWWIGLIRSRKLLATKVRERTVSLRQANIHLAQTNRALERTQAELVETAHQAGMAEVVNGVVHNIGNVLNSVGITAETLAGQLEKTRAAGVGRVAALLRTHEDDLARFLLENPQGKKLVPYLERLAGEIDKENTALRAGLERLVSGVQMMRDTVRLQQGYAKSASLWETLSLRDVVEDMLMLQTNALNRHAIRIERDFHEIRPVRVQRFKLAHILTNLIRNAIDAIDAAEPEDRFLRIGLHDDDEHVTLSVTDSGCGIPPENLSRIFAYGFTTKSHGKGFGLHSCANSMREMGGELRASSEGPGRGATFSLRIPKS